MREDRKDDNRDKRKEMKESGTKRAFLAQSKEGKIGM